MRIDKRRDDELRAVFLGPSFAKYAEGSCFVKFGDTHLICTATIEERVPPFLRNKGTGWVTAEYGMLPRSTHDRIDREAARGQQTGRTQEIQRLIGRCLRSVIDLKALGERQIRIDCDVMQADGGTRTAAITGGYVALRQACMLLLKNKKIKEMPLTDYLAAISCGIVNGTPVLDLNYQEDSTAQVDANFIMTGSGKIVEIQACAEAEPFTTDELTKMISLSQKGIQELIEKQKILFK
ncbi:MAG TPA: ribonuclease PH [Holosporales bacterium]|nr:ribonuclease PH [Holosporales bacterium]